MTRVLRLRGWNAAVLASAALLALLVLVTGVGWLASQRSRTTSYAISSPLTRIDLHLSSGRAVIVGASSPAVEVRRTDDFAFGHSARSSVRSLARCCGSTRGVRGSSSASCSASYEIAVPESVAVNVQTTAGDVRVTDFRGAAALETHSGNVDVEAYCGFNLVGEQRVWRRAGGDGVRAGAARPALGQRERAGAGAAGSLSHQGDLGQRPRSASGESCAATRLRSRSTCTAAAAASPSRAACELRARTDRGRAGDEQRAAASPREPDIHSERALKELGLRGNRPAARPPLHGAGRRWSAPGRGARAGLDRLAAAVCRLRAVVAVRGARAPARQQPARRADPRSPSAGRRSLERRLAAHPPTPQRRRVLARLRAAGVEASRHRAGGGADRGRPGVPDCVDRARAAGLDRDGARVRRALRARTGARGRPGPTVAADRDPHGGRGRRGRLRAARAGPGAARHAAAAWCTGARDPGPEPR